MTDGRATRTTILGESMRKATPVAGAASSNRSPEHRVAVKADDALQAHGDRMAVC